MAAFGVFVGLLLGLAAGGSLDNLLAVRIRWLPALLAAAIARFVLEWLLGSGVAMPDGLRIGLLALVYVPLTLALLRNHSLPGMTAAALGTIANAVAMAANFGRMPVWEPSLARAGFDSTNLHSNLHTVLLSHVDAGFFLHAGPLADIIPIPVPIMASVASVGDILLGGGLAFLLFAAVLRAPALVGASEPAAPGAIQGPLGAGGVLAHPYVRLAVNGPFSAMWMGQVVSSLGDRIHQVALVYLVVDATQNSPVAVGLVFAAMTLPGFLVGPLAGAFVDRWDYKQVMIASDLIRAALVIAIPVAAAVHLGLVYGLVLVIAIVSTFFRPARVAALPQVVGEEELLAANSAMWVGDTVSDLAGYTFAGLFVAFLGSAFAVAFWLDGASYLASAALVAGVVIPRLPRAGPVASIREELAVGARFLRHESVLFATTAQAMVAEYGLGALTALSPLLVAALSLPESQLPIAYGYFEASLGVGAVLGGLIIGGFAERLPKGLTIITAFALLGVCLLWFSIARSLPLLLVLGFAVGVANVAFVVPSQTLFQQRTPPALLGRVVAIRLALVSGVVALATITSGVLAEALSSFGSVHLVLAACGVVTILAAAGGLFVGSIRRA